MQAVLKVNYSLIFHILLPSLLMSTNLHCLPFHFYQGRKQTLIFCFAFLIQKCCADLQKPRKICPLHRWNLDLRIVGMERTKTASSVHVHLKKKSIWKQKWLKGISKIGILSLNNKTKNKRFYLKYLSYLRQPSSNLGSIILGVELPNPKWIWFA